MSGGQPMRCPQCGEDAVHQPPEDLVPWQAQGMIRPEWSHQDGTSLCPVTGPSGYQPAQPQPAQPEPGPATPSQPAAEAGWAGGRDDPDRSAGPGTVGRAYLARMIARLGDPGQPGRAEPEPEAGA
jgi:hypothetical protein